MSSRYVWLMIKVPVSELEFNNCTVNSETDVSEAWGRRELHTTYEVEWGDVTFHGYEVDLDVGDMDEVENYLIDKEMEGFFDE
jgi:hypothetical protein